MPPTSLVDMDAGASRFRALWPEVVGHLRGLYGATSGFEAWVDGLERQVRAAAMARAPELQANDAERLAHGPWWTRPDAIGYSAYVDRFAGDLNGLAGRIDYLADLGVTYLHLLPLLKPRAGDSDGGYAVADFGTVDPRLGSNADFLAMAAAARARGVRLVIDLVCNHTADDHAWALAARRGEAGYRDYYHFVGSAAEVAAWEQDLVEVFPATAPGNFTYVPEREAWVWTTFYPFQWDLNYANPAVFAEMTDALLTLANMGVDGFRLDSAPFLWKTLGTNCRNRPEAHAVLAAWRAVLSIAAPSVALKAEAIERLADVLPFFGEEGAPECDLAYNNGVMAGLWASLALGEAAPAAAMISSADVKPERGAWINYLRCHDDIIFGALSPEVAAGDQARAAARLGGEGDTFSRGRIFQVFDGVASVNGMAASLCGFGGGDEALAEARLRLLYGVLFALDGVPVIYMGDELALTNDEGFLQDPERRAEGRWLQRPAMDWRHVEDALAGDGVPGRMLAAMRRYARLRQKTAALSDPVTEVAEVGPGSPLLHLRRGRGRAALEVLANVSGEAIGTPLPADGPWRDLLGRDLAGAGEALELAPYELLWLEAR